MSPSKGGTGPPFPVPSNMSILGQPSGGISYYTKHSVQAYSEHVSPHGVHLRSQGPSFIRSTVPPRSPTYPIEHARSSLRCVQPEENTPITQDTFRSILRRVRSKGNTPSHSGHVPARRAARSRCPREWRAQQTPSRLRPGAEDEARDAPLPPVLALSVSP